MAQEMGVVPFWRLVLSRSGRDTNASPGSASNRAGQQQCEPPRASLRAHSPILVTVPDRVWPSLTVAPPAITCYARYGAHASPGT